MTKVKKKRRYTTKQRIAIFSLAVIALIGFTMAGLQGLYLYQRNRGGQESDLQIEGVSDGNQFVDNVINKKEKGSTILQRTDDAGREYLDETLFLGDSNTARFLGVLSEDDGLPLTNADNTIAVAGLGIQGISSTACMRFSTGTYNMVDSVAILQPKRILITLGTNNLGVSISPDEFIREYNSQIQLIRNAYPYADIIINTIPPISMYTTYTNVQQELINLCNEEILKMCEKNGYYFLNSIEDLIDQQTGYAKVEYMSDDGLHFSDLGANVLFKYIRTHALITEDIRPKPLADIPMVIGPDTSMLTIDPLTNQEFSEDFFVPTIEPKEEPTPEPTQEPEPEQTPEPEPEPEPTPEPEPEPEPEPVPEPEPEPEPVPEPEPPAEGGDEG